MDSAVNRLLVAVLVGFGLPLVWWAIPGGRGPDSLPGALAMGVVLTLLGFVLITIRRTARGGALAAGQALREEHDAERAGEGEPHGR